MAEKVSEERSTPAKSKVGFSTLTHVTTSPAGTVNGDCHPPRAL